VVVQAACQSSSDPHEGERHKTDRRRVVDDVHFAVSFLVIALGLVVLGLAGVVKGTAGIIGVAVLLLVGFTASSAARLVVRRRLHRR
jgi:hypothetical protein